MVNGILCKKLEALRGKTGEKCRRGSDELQKTDGLAWLLRPFAAGLAAGVLVLLMPLLLIGEGEAAEEPPQLLPASPSVSPGREEAESWDEGQTVRILTEQGQVEELTMREYLWRVVAAEMPAKFELEAMSAQAVCARTYTLWKMGTNTHEGADLCDNSACCQAYITPEEAAGRWGSLAEVYTEHVASAVERTDGRILTYEGKPIQAVFFSSSAPETEDAAAVWGGSLPYLVSVSSPEGEEVPNYYSSVVLTDKQVKSLVADSGLGIRLSGDPSGWIRNVSYTASGRVAEVEVGGVTLSGSAARSLFGLRSACFEVVEDEGTFTFSVTGYGHGVGMSQYGANAMAEAGSTWQEIVSHYYTGVTIQNAE